MAKLSSDTIKLTRKVLKERKENVDEITGLGDMAYDAKNKPKLSTEEAEAKVTQMIRMFTDTNDSFGIMETLDDLGIGRGQGNLGGDAFSALKDLELALLKVNKRPGFGDEDEDEV